MIADPMFQAINDARALLDTLIASDWNDIHVVSGESEIFIAKTSGRANPMLERHDVAPAEPAASRAIVREEVRAPHVCTLVEVVPVGTRVSVGDRVAVLRVLDDEQPLLATLAGTVGAHPADVGGLLDFGAPVVVLELAA